MNIKSTFLILASITVLVVVGWGRFEVRLLVPDGFRGVIRVVARSDGDKLRSFFPRIIVDSTGVVHVKSVARLFGLRRVVGYWKESGRTIPTRFGVEASTGAVCLWELPTSINPEACFFIGTATEHSALMEDHAFLQELGRDRRSNK